MHEVFADAAHAPRIGRTTPSGSTTITCCCSHARCERGATAGPSGSSSTSRSRTWTSSDAPVGRDILDGDARLRSRGLPHAGLRRELPRVRRDAPRIALRADASSSIAGQFTSVGAFPIGIFPESFQEPPEPALVAGDRRPHALARDRRSSCSASTASTTRRGSRSASSRSAGSSSSSRSGAARSRSSRSPCRRAPTCPSTPSSARASRRSSVASTGSSARPHWVPIRYLYRGYERSHLRQLYRAAHVGYVTPLRDGMNLVAKEYVAAQDPEDPGVLVLSRVRRRRGGDDGRDPHEPVPRRRHGARPRSRAPHAARGAKDAARAPPRGRRADDARRPGPTSFLDALSACRTGRVET